MAIGYDILNGRQGASGYCRETGGQTELHARGLRPGDSCALYELLPDHAKMREEQTADGNGQAVFTCRSGNALFVTANGRVRLWQGGEENYLRACDWLKREQSKTGETLPSISPEQIKETEKPTKEESDAAQNILARDLEEIQIPITAAEHHQPEEPATAEKQVPAAPEPAYTLRAPGAGEPVDALPN